MPAACGQRYLPTGVNCSVYYEYISIEHTPNTCINVYIYVYNRHQKVFAQICCILSSTTNYRKSSLIVELEGIAISTSLLSVVNYISPPRLSTARVWSGEWCVIQVGETRTSRGGFITRHGPA